MGIVAIVGRPNVGKSTLFNRLAGRRQAIVDPVSGVTRDRHYGKTDWNGREFSIIDTGGYAEKSGDFFEEQIQRQVLIAIEQADVVLFVVDVQTGITDYDLTIADLLRKSGKSHSRCQQSRRRKVYIRYVCFPCIGFGRTCFHSSHQWKRHRRFAG